MVSSQLYWRVFTVILTLALSAVAATHFFSLTVAAALMAVLALAATAIVVGHIIGPLEALTRAAQQLAEGAAPDEVAVQSHNEIGRLATAFNSMSQQLAARIGDLEEQRRQLEHNHARLETVLGAMLEGVVAVDADQRLLFANNAAIRLLDLKPAVMIGRPVWEAVRHADVQELLRQAFSGDNPPRMEFELPQTHCTVAAMASRLPGAPSPGVVLVLHDVTELRRLESLRREFVQNVSHELKTPLSSIAAYADTLLEGALDDPDCNRVFVQRIAEQGDRLHALILDLLSLARMEADEQVFDVEPTEVSRIIAVSLDAHTAVAKAKQITLESCGPDEAVSGYADDEGLRTILDNLLDNALNYTPNGGRVTIRWHRADDRIQIAVQDSGVGIAREHQARIFQRFYRIDKARSRELGGTGLGLAIVKHLCQVFGGSISVHSVLGQGSTFTVELRAAPALVTQA